MSVDNLLLSIEFPRVTLGLNVYGWKLTEVLCQNKLQAQTLFILFKRSEFDTLLPSQF